MANQKLSAITASGANLVAADTLVGINAGTTDLLFSGTQIKALMSASPTITGHATIEGVTATGATGTGKFVFDGTPTLVTPVLGVATGTSIALNGATLGTNKLAVTGTVAVSSTLSAAGITDTAHTTVEGVTSTGATGTGKFVFDGTPTLVTPVLGVATATSINGNTFTTGTYTLTGVAGKTLTFNKSITLEGTDSTTMTFPPASASIGYLNVPINGQNAGYTCVASDSGKCIVMQTAGTFTIPAEGSVNYALGTVLTFINNSTSSTIPITSDTMTLANSSTTGTRTLAAKGIATAIKIASATWIISGTGLT